MAKSVVRSEMPRMKVPTATTSRDLNAPFTQPRTGGNGGSNIPTHTMESLGETKQATVSASFASAPAEGSRQSRRYPMKK
jgi:hypothetical protein